MVDSCVAPSELHLKKELTSLRKARYLRDPETCSSWRTPMNSKSLVTSCGLNYENEFGGKSGKRNTDKLLRTPASENVQEKVYLYNWRRVPSKSSVSGIKVDEDSIDNPRNGDSTSDSYLEDPSNIYIFKRRNQATPVRRTVKKLRNGISKKEVSKHSAVSKLLDLPSTSVGILNSAEQSDDTEYSNSEDFLQLRQELPQKAAGQSVSSSPLLSGSRCGNWSYSSKMLRTTKREGSSRSYTPASTSSYYRYEAATSLDGDELDQLGLPRDQGCGIPCYWRKRTKDKGCGGFYSPSLSDTLRRKGSSLICGSRTLYNTKRSSGSYKKKLPLKPSQGMPLLINSFEEGSSLDSTSDELSINYGELELEALSRLDGKRWSVCKSQEAEVEFDKVKHKSLSERYMPRSFNEIIGQNIVAHSLKSSLLKGRVAPAYIFQGPRGTGKTSTARIFAAALNCLSTEDNKPCGFCRECSSVFSGNGTNVKEVDAINKKGIDRVKYLLQNLTVAKAASRYKVFIIDGCHMLSSRMWSKFMNFIEELRSHVVFIFVTIDLDNLPQGIISRCQKYHFSKIKDVDIVSQLRKISYEDNLDIELDALDLITLNSDGSLQDAETMLEQLSLLGKRITTSLVNELVGVVSDEKLLDLLEIAMSSDTAETVRRSRELMNSGIDPMALMSQLAGLIMDIIAGSNQLANSQCTVSEDELKRLQQALKILSDAEKQLKLSSERSTWFTAALLQLGSDNNIEFTQSSNSSKHSIKRNNDGIQNLAKDSSLNARESSSVQVSRSTSGYSSPHSCTPKMPDTASKKEIVCSSPAKLALIWRRCIQKCNSETLRLLLIAHGKLVLLTKTGSALIAHVEFKDENAKLRAERYLSSIAKSAEIVLQHTVEVRLGLMPEVMLESDCSKLSVKDKGIPIVLPRKSIDVSKAISIQDGIYEHRLENAWLQASDKNSQESTSRSNPNKNQVFPQGGVGCENHKIEDELSHDLKALKLIDTQKEQIGALVDQYTISPSLLHSNNGFTANFDKDISEYESRPGCSGLFCWQPRKTYKGKMKKVPHGRSPKISRLNCLGNMRGRSNKKQNSRTIV